MLRPALGRATQCFSIMNGTKIEIQEPVTKALKMCTNGSSHFSTLTDNECPPLLVQRRSEKAILPKQASKTAAGFDLFSIEKQVIPPYGKALVGTGISIALPPNSYGRVAPRSGLAVKHHLDVGAGVIDEDYRGEIKVVMFNFSNMEYQVSEGDRIAQLVIERIWHPEIVEVLQLDDTERGAGGFGSTGKQ